MPTVLSGTEYSESVQNYHLLTTAQTNSTQAGIRYMREHWCKCVAIRHGWWARRRWWRRRAAQQNQGLRQSVNANYNWSHSASDNVNMFPQLGGKTSSEFELVQAGYTMGYHRFTNIFNVNWNRSVTDVTNFFTNGPDIETQLGILGPNNAPLNSTPLNYGLPSIVLSNLSRA